MRIKDVHFEAQHIIVRAGEGHKDRVIVLPLSQTPLLQEHLQRVHHLYMQDLDAGYASVYLPSALARKYPTAGRDWVWQYFFPSERRSRDPRTQLLRRHHVDESGRGGLVVRGPLDEEHS